MKCTWILLLLLGCAVSMTESTSPYEEAAPISPPPLQALPFSPEDLGGNQFLSPFGVVRKTLDRNDLGHSGIDVPLNKGAPLYAVAAGTIVSVEAGDRVGSNVKLIIKETQPGEGWGFFYEHVHPTVTPGTRVVAGEVIGKNALRSGNNHLEFAYYFSSYTYGKEYLCWIDSLPKDLVETIDITPYTQNWQTAHEEGYYPLRALYATPNWCYPAGTDVREKTS